MTSAKDDFIKLIYENAKVQGLDEVSSKAIGILFVEVNEVSLEELAERTNYSLSAVSTAMKFLEGADVVKKIKKPKSKKIYFFIEKDMRNTFIRMLQKKLGKIILPAKERMPSIIEKYKKAKSKNAKQELIIAENYYKQTLVAEKMIKHMLKMMACK